MAKKLFVEADIVDVLQKLPKVCAARLLSDKSPIFIRRGEPGYHPAPPGTDVADFNRRHGVTAKQVEAMLTGSMFGFHVPGANPDNCEGNITEDCV